MRKEKTMNRNITKISVALLFAALCILTVNSAQANESIWFSGNEQYRPASNVLNDGSCYNAAHNSENIFLATASGPNQEVMAGTCSVKDGRNFNIWFQTDNH
jgi:hypothetical protein